MDLAFLLAQLFNGLMLGSFYVLLSLGLSIIFGMLGMVNFAHGALYMLGAYAAYTVCHVWGLSFWLALVLAPAGVGAIGYLVERLLLKRLSALPHYYMLLMTFGLMIFIEEVVRLIFSPTGKPFPTPAALASSLDLGFIVFPRYRLFIILVTLACALAVWFFVEKTDLGAVIRAGTDDARMVSSLGIDISRVFSLVFALGAALAGLAGVLAAPVQNVVPEMGASVLTDTFVVVIVGGLGSIGGSILAGLVIGELITVGVIFWPPAANAVVYVFMALVLLLRPRGLFGRAHLFD
jgi:branched-chain amino acid transport system permease protein